MGSLSSATFFLAANSRRISAFLFFWAGFIWIYCEMGAVNLFTAAVETIVFVTGGDGAYGPSSTAWESVDALATKGSEKKRSLNQIGWPPRGPGSGDNIELISFINKNK